MVEKWIPIRESCEYELSSLGRLRDIKTKEYVTCDKDQDGYLCKMMTATLTHYRKYRIHRLVGKYFVEGYTDDCVLKFLDGNIENCAAWNIRLADTRFSHPIFCETNKTYYHSVHECARQLGINRSGIIACCSGKLKSYRGYKFVYGDFSDDFETPHPRIRIRETGQIFWSVADCAEAINGDRSAIVKCLKGTRKCHKGYRFEYVDE